MIEANIMSKVILYIATSYDGFIADKNGGVDWLPQPDDQPKIEEDEFGYQALMNRISIIIMGHNSYQQILGFGEWAWKDKTTYVFTYEPLTIQQKNIFFVNEDVRTFMDKLRIEQPNADIWLLGGAQLAKSFAQENLIDELIITVVPTVLHEGIKLDLPYDNFNLLETKQCRGNMVQKFYERKA